VKRGKQARCTGRERQRGNKTTGRRAGWGPDETKGFRPKPQEGGCGGRPIIERARGGKGFRQSREKTVGGKKKSPEKPWVGPISGKGFAL